MDPIPKAFIATMLTQLSCATDAVSLTSTAAIDGCRAILVPGVGNVQLYGYVSDVLEGSTHSFWRMIGWLLLTLAVVRAFSIYLFKTVSHIKR
jgi:hypothetical protein